MKTKVVIFSEHGAKVLINPPNINTLRMQPNVLVDPSLHLVKGLSPHCWKKVGQDVFPKDDKEILVTVPPKYLKVRRNPVYYNFAVFLTIINIFQLIVYLLTFK